MLRRDLGGQFAFPALLIDRVLERSDGRGAEGIGAGGSRLGRVDADGRSAAGLTARAEEPHAVFHDEAAERSFVDADHLVGVRGRLDRRERDPVGVADAVTERAGELVAARFGQRADHTAAEPAVFRRDRAGENGGLLNRVFNEEIVRLTAQVLIDRDAVDEEQVVVRGRTGNREVVARAVVVDSGREGDGVGDVAAHRQQRDLLVGEVARHLRRLENRGSGGRDGDRFRHRRDPHVGVGTCGPGERHHDLLRAVGHAGQFEYDGVFTRRQRREGVRTSISRGGGARALQRGRRDRHRDSRKACAVRSRVADQGTGDLPECCGCEQECKQNYHYVTDFGHISLLLILPPASRPDFNGTMAGWTRRSAKL